ncbi:MAG: hypothetical protein SGJ19_25590 [Planctomycetia bacterium]|nr:hypothetical protein [Planctomycetia bacterium]
MSLFENHEYRWRETYFVLFERAKRPTLDEFKEMLVKLPGHFKVSAASVEDDNLIESVTVVAPEDNAALDISYVDGEEVVEQANELQDQIKPGDDVERQKLRMLNRASARLDVMHFEHVSTFEAEEEEDDLLDPSALLVILDHLVEMTGGIAIDPQSGTLL